MQCALSEAQTEHVQAILQPNHFATFIDGWPAPWQDPRSTAHSAAAWQHGSTVAETLRRYMHCARQLCQESITMPMLVHVQVGPRRTPSVRSAAAGTPWCWCTSMLFIRERVTSSSRFSPLCSAGGPQGARDLRAERRRRLHSGGDAGAQGAGRPPALRLRRQRPAALQGEHVPLQAHTVVHVRLEGRNQSAGF